MTKYSAFRLQKAIYATLDGDATLMATVQGIYDNPKEAESVTFPYIVISDYTLVPNDTKTEDGAEITWTLHVFSNTGNNEQVAGILERITDLLDDADLTVENNELVNLHLDGLSTVINEPTEGGLIKHGVIRFRAVTQSTS